MCVISVRRNRYKNDVQCVLIPASHLNIGALQNDAGVWHVVMAVRLLHIHNTQQNCYLLFDVLRNLQITRMPNVMVALPNIGGVLCSTPQSLADAHY